MDAPHVADDGRRRERARAVELKARPWNYTVGVRGLVARHFEIVVEAGFGDRTHGLVNLGYRF